MTPPDLTFIEGALHCHDKTERSQSSNEHGCHSNNSNLLSHPSFWNDSIMKNNMHDSCLTGHEQKAAMQIDDIKEPDRQMKNTGSKTNISSSVIENNSSETSGEKITDALQNHSEIFSNFGLRQNCAELPISFIEARNVSDDVHCGTVCCELGTGSYKTHKIIPCTKEAQLAKRKKDILASRNTVQCNMSLAAKSTESVNDKVVEGEAHGGSSNSPDYAGLTCMVPHETRSLHGITGTACTVPYETTSEHEKEKVSSERNRSDLDASLHCTLMDNCVNGTSIQVGPVESTGDGCRNDRQSDYSSVNASLEDIPGCGTGKVVEIPVASGVVHFLKQFIEKHR